MSKLLLAILTTLTIIPMGFAETIKTNVTTSNTLSSPIKKYEVFFDKITYENQADFEKNIPIEKMNSLVNSYANSLKLLTASSQINWIRIEVILDKNSQSFSVQTKNSILPTEKDLYQQVTNSLNKIEKPQVNTKLKFFIFAHIAPL